MRHSCNNTLSHKTNLALQTFHSAFSLVFPHASFVSLLRSSPRHVLLFSCTVHLHVWVCMRDCTSFTTHVWLYYVFKCVCGSWRCSRPIGGLALTRMSPQAPVLVGCLVLALHVSWLSAVRLYPTLGSLPGGEAILPSPWTPASLKPPAQRRQYTLIPAFISSTSCVQHWLI